MDNKDIELISQIRKGNTEAIKTLLENGANPNAIDASGCSALTCAITSLIQVKKKVGNPTKIVLYTAEPSLENVKLLLEAGANPNTCDNSKRTALMEAVARNHDISKLLLSYGADPNKQSLGGATALMLAAHYKNNDKTVEALIDGGADINTEDNSLKTALMWAARANNIQAVRMLVSNGADINHQDQTGRTALIWAVQDENYAMINILLELGADINIADRANNTAMDIALDLNNPDIINNLEQAKNNHISKGKNQAKQDTAQLKYRNATKQRNLRRFLGR